MKVQIKGSTLSKTPVKGLILITTKEKIEGQISIPIKKNTSLVSRNIRGRPRKTTIKETLSQSPKLDKREAVEQSKKRKLEAKEMVQITGSKLKTKKYSNKTLDIVINLEELEYPEKKGVANTRHRTRSFISQPLKTCIHSTIDFYEPVETKIVDIHISILDVSLS
jgi:hypothetical protein